jgi:hypothetical protein
MKMKKSVLIALTLLYATASSAQQKFDEFDMRKAWDPRKEKRVNIHIQLSTRSKEERPRSVFYNYAVTFGCISRHETSPYPNPYRQNNPCLGIVKFFDTKVLGGTPYLAYRKIWENSRDGQMRAYGPGLEWELAQGPYVNLIGGVTYARIYYEDAWRNRSATINAPVPHLGLKHGQQSVVVEALGPKAISIVLRTEFN